MTVVAVYKNGYFEHLFNTSPEDVAGFAERHPDIIIFVLEEVNAD